MRPHRHCEPTGRANARPMTGSAKQSIARAVIASEAKQSILPRKERMDCFAPKKKQTDKLLILFNVMDEPPPSVLFHPRGSAKGRCGTRNDGKNAPSLRLEIPGLRRGQWREFAAVGLDIQQRRLVE